VRKNYETVSKFVKVVPGLFFPKWCIISRMLLFMTLSNRWRSFWLLETSLDQYLENYSSKRDSA